MLPFGRLWYDKPDDAIGYATFYNCSHDAVIRVYDAAGNVIETGSRPKTDDAVIRVYDATGKVIEMHEHKSVNKNPPCREARRLIASAR